MADVIISGYYGLGNSGDEALLKSIVDNLRQIEPKLSITALSGNARHTKEAYGINTVDRFSPLGVIKAMRNSKLLISGGGSLIQDATSTKSLLYYLGIILLAKAMGLKVMLYANGMGPISEKNVKKVHRVLNKVDLITLRENVSLNEIRRCNIYKPTVTVTADPAYLLEPCSQKRTNELLAQLGIEDKKYVVVSVREWKNAAENFEDETAYAIDSLAEEGYFALFIPMQLSRDKEISQRIAAKMHHPSAVLDKEISVSEMLGIISRSSTVIGMRLHTLIFASAVSVPMIGIIYDPKIKGTMEYMHQPYCIDAAAMDGKELLKMAKACLDNSEKIKKQLETENEILRGKAAQNAELAVELLKKD